MRLLRRKLLNNSRKLSELVLEEQDKKTEWSKSNYSCVSALIVPQVERLSTKRSHCRLCGGLFNKETERINGT